MATKKPKTEKATAPVTSAVAKEKQTIEQMIGVDELEVTTFDANLLRKGVIGQVSVHRWRGIISLDPQDLGITISPETQKTLRKLGERILMPKELLDEADAIENRVRRVFDPKQNRALIATPLGTFIPVTAFTAVRDAFEDCRNDYMNLRDHWTKNLPAIREEMAQAYATAAKETYARIMRESPLFDQTEDAFVDQFVDRVLARIPEKETIEATFYMEMKLAMVPMPSIFEEDQLRAQELQKESTVRMQELETQRAQAERKEWEERDAKDQLEVVFQQMKAEAIRQENEIFKTTARNFQDTVARQMNQLALEATSDILASIKKNGKPNNRNSATLKNLVETLRQANFTNDEQVASMIKRVDTILGANPKTRSNANIQQVLQDIAIVARQTIMATGGTIERERDLVIGDVTLEEIEISRRRLISEEDIVIEQQPELLINRPREI